MSIVTTVVGDNRGPIRYWLICGIFFDRLHRFNLAVKLVIRDHKQLLSKVNSLMCKFRNLKLYADMRQHTNNVQSLATLRGGAAVSRFQS